ncbi:hypothetical protein Q3C01_28445 [Bradyrhizobium sp. UFLA05-109]
MRPKFAQLCDFPQERNDHGGIVVGAVPNSNCAVCYLPTIIFSPIQLTKVSNIHLKKNANFDYIRTQRLEVAGEDATNLTLMDSCNFSGIRDVEVSLLHGASKVSHKNASLLTCKFHANRHNLNDEDLQIGF